MVEQDGQGGARPQDFDRSVNPTQSGERGADFTHHIITGPPDFQSFLRPWDVSNRKLIVCANTVRFFIWTFTVVGHQRFSSINCELVFFFLTCS